MSTTRTTRSTHRWFSVAFTATVVANVVSAIAGGPTWVGYLALVPLVLLMLTGWYLLWVTSDLRHRRLERRLT